MFKVNNIDTRMMVIVLFWCFFLFFVNFEHMSHLVLLFLLLTLNMQLMAGKRICF